VLLLFAAAIAWVVNNSPGRRLAPEELASATRSSDQGSGASIDESLGATDIYVKGTEWSETGEDGKVTMRLRFEEATKQRSLYTIREGSLRFSLRNHKTGEEKDTLVVTLSNASYSAEAGLIRVKGTLLGEVSQGGHYFKADELSWDQGEMQVRTKAVQYTGPSIQVTGQGMSVNLENGEVRFDGPVDVGI
jgi:hypothetical protein